MSITEDIFSKLSTVKCTLLNELHIIVIVWTSRVLLKYFIKIIFKKCILNSF